MFLQLLTIFSSFLSSHFRKNILVCISTSNSLPPGALSDTRRKVLTMNGTVLTSVYSPFVHCNSRAHKPVQLKTWLNFRAYIRWTPWRVISLLWRAASSVCSENLTTDTQHNTHMLEPMHASPHSHMQRERERGRPSNPLQYSFQCTPVRQENQTVRLHTVMRA